MSFPRPLRLWTAKNIATTCNEVIWVEGAGRESQRSCSAMHCQLLHPTKGSCCGRRGSSFARSLRRPSDGRVVHEGESDKNTEEGTDTTSEIHGCFKG